MPDETDPPRKNYGFKEREFKRDNRAASASRPPLPTAQDLAKMAGPVTRSTPTAPGAAKAGDPNDVYATLQQNRTAEMKSKGDAIEIKKISSRRKKEYWLTLIVGNLAILSFVAFLGLNPVTACFGLGGVIIYSLGLTWVMWQVMGKY